MIQFFFVHGFGVTKDARGLFTDIISGLDEAFGDGRNIYETFDLNNFKSNDIQVNPLSFQAQIFKDIYSKKKNEEVKKICISHSQGCLVTALSNIGGFDRVFFLAPPTLNDMQRTFATFQKRPGTQLNLDSESVLIRSDGSRTIVPKEYWEDRSTLNYEKIYKNFSKNNHVISIFALEDEIVEYQKASLFGYEKVVKLHGNHNFENGSRQTLIQEIINNI